MANLTQMPGVVTSNMTPAAMAQPNPQPRGFSLSNKFDFGRAWAAAEGGSQGAQAYDLNQQRQGLIGQRTLSAQATQQANADKSRQEAEDRNFQVALKGAEYLKTLPPQERAQAAPAALQAFGMDPEYFEQFKTSGILNDLSDEKLTGFLSTYGEKTTLKDGEARLGFDGKPIYVNRAHEVKAHGDNLQAFDPSTGQFGATQTRGQTFGEQTADRELDETVRSNIAGEDNTAFQNTTNRMNARTSRMKAESPNAGPAEFGDVMKLKADFDKQARDFEGAYQSYKTMENLAQDATGASDVALGFAFFKSIDPASTVREGEFAMTGQAMGLSSQLVAKLAQVDNGQRFTPQLRQELIQGARHAVEQQHRTLEGLRERNATLAQDYNIPADRVTYDPTGGAGIPKLSGAPEAPAIQSPQELEALPSGARFTAPDGSIRVKP